MRTEEQVLKDFEELGYKYLDFGDWCEFYVWDEDIRIHIFKNTKEVEKIKDWIDNNTKVKTTKKERQLIKQLFKIWKAKQNDKSRKIRS